MREGLMEHGFSGFIMIDLENHDNPCSILPTLGLQLNIFQQLGDFNFLGAVEMSFGTLWVAMEPAGTTREWNRGLYNEGMIRKWPISEGRNG